MADEAVQMLEDAGFVTEEMQNSLPKVAGDPHVQNLKGEKFDILVTGRVNLLEYPRRAVTPKIHVVAHIARVGKCEQTFMEQIDIIGTWIPEVSSEAVSKLSFAARPGSNRSFVLRHDQSDWVPTVSPVVLQFPQLLKLEISINRHHRWNFLEVHVHGIHSLQNDV